MSHVKSAISSLPPPDAAALAHAERLLSALQSLIAEQGGWIGFDRYMAHVLYAPGLGYYHSGTTKFGAEGDFITAPLMTPLFSRVLAQAILPCLRKGGEVLELGAGNGVMAADILQVLSDELGAENTPAYKILEPSPDLQARQAETLRARAPELLERVSWLEALPADGSFDGVIIGNEVVDALPVKRFTIQDGDVFELGVGWGAAGPQWRVAEAEAGFAARIRALLPEPLSAYADGYASEVHAVLEGWLAALSSCLRRGQILLLDYGYARKAYYSSERMAGTLRGYYRHHAIEDPFVWPGLCDLTTWVDFTAVVEAAKQAGLSLAGYTSQANFLLENDIAGLMQGTVPDDLNAQLQQAEAIKQLMMPGEMGESVKVIALNKATDACINGFARDMRYQL